MSCPVALCILFCCGWSFVHVPGPFLPVLPEYIALWVALWCCFYAQYKIKLVVICHSMCRLLRLVIHFVIFTCTTTRLLLYRYLRFREDEKQRQLVRRGVCWPSLGAEGRVHGPTMEHNCRSAPKERVRAEPEHAHPCVSLVAQLNYDSSYQMSFTVSHTHSGGIIVPTERRLL